MSKFKSIIFKLLLISLVFFTLQCGGVKTELADISSLKYPNMPEIKLPTPEKFTLSNGMTFFLIEDHRLPLIEMSVLIKTSTLYDPDYKKGLAGLTGTVMRTGGTEKMTGDEIDLKLESLAAIVETSITRDSGNAYLNCLKDNFDTSLSVLADILRSPRFDQDKIKLAKVTAKSGISRRNDDINQIAQREFNRLLWGKNSAQGKIAEYDTINGIARDDMLKFHVKYFVPNNMLVGVVGDFDSKEMKKKLTDTFKSWKKVETVLPKIKYRDKIKPAVGYALKEDTTQSVVRIGYILPEMKYNNQDRAAVSLMNTILGESFASRLFKEVRTKKGLAYSVFSRFTYGWNEPGSFLAYCQTKLESTSMAIDTIMETINGMKTGNITKDEFRLAKNYYLNSFVFNFEKNRDIVEAQLELSYNDYPADYYEKFREDLENVTIKDVQRVAKKYLDTSSIILFAVGNKDKFDAPLSKYGKVTEIDITIPDPKAPQMPDATPESIKAGNKIIQKVIKAYGGADRLKKNLNRIEDYTLTFIAPQGRFAMKSKAFSIYPYKQRQEISSPMGNMVRIFNGKEGWNIMGGVPKAMTSTEVETARKDIKREFRWIIRNLDKVTLYLAAKDKSDKSETLQLILKEGDEHIITFFVDPKTYHVVKKTYMGKNPMSGAPAKQVLVHSEFKKVKGILIPFKTDVHQGGKPLMEIELHSVKINSKIDLKLFENKKK